MARHLSINIRAVETGFPDWLCTALASPGHFRLAALGGIEGHEGGDHWFLSGYALEDFVDRFIARAPSRPASIEMAAGPDGSNLGYLGDVASRLRDLRALAALSPFETASVEAGVTFLDDHRISSQEIARCRGWFAAHPKAVLYFYGAVDLSAPSPEPSDAPWGSAFRELDAQGEAGDPFLLVRAGAAPLAEGSFDVTLRAQSTRWLDGELRRLPRLVAVAEGVLRAAAGRVKSASLEMAGGPFLRQEQQIRGAFSPVFAKGA